MTRLWDKGSPLDDRVLSYTAGEDFGLDERLVRYDVRASIAHAEMLHDQRLLSAGDLEEIRSGLTALADEHARGLWHIELTDEDGQTALEWRLTQGIGAAGGRGAPARCRFGRVGLPRRSATTPRVCLTCTGAQERVRWGRPPVTGRRGFRSTARR